MTSKQVTRRSFLGFSAAGVLAGCATFKSPGAKGRIATFNADVTPPLGTPIYSSFQPLAVIEQPLQAKGVIIDDGSARYVLCAVDYCELCNSTYTRWRKAVADAAGAEPGCVALHTVHQHTAPMLDEDSFPILDSLASPCVHPSVDSIQIPLDRLVSAVRSAQSQFQPYSQIGAGQAKAERVASNRRIPNGDGTVTTRYSSCKDPKLIDAPEGLIDPYVKTITFANGDKPVARLHYYATHPQSFYGDPRASIDFAGMAREWLENQEGVFQVYFNGCGGNIAAGKYNDATPEARQGLYERLRAAMKAAADSTQYAPASPIVLRSTTLTLMARSDGPWAQPELDAQLAKADAHPNARSGAAMFMAFKNRANVPFELSSIQMGDQFILNLPGEVAIEYQLFAQELRPDKFVAAAAYADCGPAYINLEKFTAEGGYEPTASHSIPQSELPMRNAIKKLLK
ncbi:MAG: hypothetical protein NTZ09_05695 [Candidatus Hydrogenedentes bacterium]|nr:hypothetical protein [Candidatus Hydrogenedentota bacterium]